MCVKACTYNDNVIATWKIFTVSESAKIIGA